MLWAYLCPKALLCHLFQARVELLQEGLAAGLQVVTAEGSGLQNEGHTAEGMQLRQCESDTLYLMWLSVRS